MNELLQLVVAMCAISGPTSSSAAEIKNVQTSCQRPKLECLVQNASGFDYKERLNCLTK